MGTQVWSSEERLGGICTEVAYCVIRQHVRADREEPRTEPKFKY